MSILLSTYWTQAIVFSAHKNATLSYVSGLESSDSVDVGAAIKNRPHSARPRLPELPDSFVLNGAPYLRQLGR